VNLDTVFQQVLMKQFFQGLQWKGNIYRALALYFLLSMLLMSICRLGFFLFNLEFFPGLSLTNITVLFIGGLKFDLAAMLYVNAVFILLFIIPFDFRFSIAYRWSLRLLFFITNGLALAANVMDFVYYKFTLRRTTADVFEQFENETNLSGLFLSFITDYWYALVFWILLLVVMVILYNRVEYYGPLLRNRVSYYLLGVVAVPIIAYAMIGGIRGGFRHSTRPITLSNAGEYVTDPNQVSIVLNTPFALFRTIGKTKIKRSTYFATDEMAEQIYSPLYINHDTAQFKKLNVVVIILESFSEEFFGFYTSHKKVNGYTGYTPFLDSLLIHSKTTLHAFANGRKSIDGLPSVMASIPSLGTPYFLTPFSGNNINSLGSLLKKEGYHTSFFHGAPNGSMGFNSFMNIAGFDHYYGMNEYPNPDDFDGLWGIWDEPFFNFYADKLSEFPQPFISSIFSVSSHHPFKLPAEHVGKFKGGEMPILKCIEYTDYALRKFFRKVATTSWYANTLFVITADHTSSNIVFDESRTAAGLYAVPIAYFRPDNSLASLDTTITQQIDIMPSVLDYLNYNKPYLAFGKSVFSNEGKPFAFNYNNGYQLFEDNYLLLFDGQRSSALYNFSSDVLLNNNLVHQLPEIVGQKEQKLKAIIQQYNNRLIDNRMVVK
jgi:phosphoglycerol transferase MdoB-like AlkP superfamily enzyme